MKHDSLGQTLDESLNNAESWIRQAEQQLMMAKAIAPKVRLCGQTEASVLLCVGYLRTITLLLALATENSLKAVKASRSEFVVNDKGLERHSLGGGSNGHSLIELARGIGFPLTQPEEQLLVRLTEIGIWAGKYHVPIRRDAFERANQANPVSLSLPSDLLLVKTFILRAARIAGVNTVVA